MKKDLENVWKKQWDALQEAEKKAFSRILSSKTVSRDSHREYEDARTFGERLADNVASFGGSWTFIISFGLVLLFWVFLNSFILAKSGNTFDPYPYILLNLFLSMLASIQAPIIMMSQNRQAIKDRLDAKHDYEVNLKAELEICAIQEKLDDLRDSK